MSKKQQGKKYLKVGNRKQIKETIQKLIYLVTNDQIDVQKSNALCRLIQIQLSILDEEVQEELDALTEIVNKLDEEGKV